MNDKLNRTACFLCLSLGLILGLSPRAFAQLPAPTYGWNLGNDLEATCGVGCWGPTATQPLINSVAAAGFNTVRIPCAWDSHANQTTYVIDPTYMAQVKQVVDWCYAKNLYVVVNDHWDGGWLQDHLTGTVNSTINAKMNSYWGQIAATFATYDNHLLFAGANEPNVDTAAKMSELTTYYNTFISAVRGKGGNNSSRWLVVQGPKTDINTTDSLMNTLPTDPTSGRLMVEIHYYDPYQYTLMTTDQSWGNMFYFWGAAYHSTTLSSRNSTWGEEAGVDTQFQKMTAKFTSKGVPVLLGEFGVVKRTGYSDLTGADLNLHLASRTYFDKYVVDSAHSHGLSPIYWDAGGLGSNTMWLFDRTTAAVIDPDCIHALTGGAALPPPGSGPPPVPTGLAATAGNAQVALTWNASSGATAYDVKRSTVNGSGYATVSTPTTTSYTNTGLTNGTTYYFVVDAKNASGTSANSTQASATPTVPAPPAAPTGLAATAGNAQVALTWNASSGATAYDVKRSTVSGSGYATVSSPTVTNYTDTGLTNGTTYYYVVDAKNAAGTSANSTQVSAIPNLSIPPVPMGLAATAGNAQVALTWNTSSGATAYDVKRSTVSGSGYVTVSSPTAASYTNTGLTNGTTYYFVVDAKNSAGTSANSSQVSATPTAATSSLKVQYRCGNTAASTQQIQPILNIVNTGSTAVALNTLKLRYYYTIDTTQPETFNCDYASFGNVNVSGTFNPLSPTKATADTYLEVSFAAAAGNLNANSNTGDIQIRFNKNDWSSFTQTNDYSFDATKTTDTDWTKVTLYQNGTLVWGTTP